MKSKMQETMERQADDLRRLHADTGRIEELAALLAERRVFVIGTGTSWHAASQGALFLRKAGVDAWAIPSADFYLDGPAAGPNDSVVAMTHTGAKRYTGEALKQARSDGAVTVVISGLGVEGADLETVPREVSAAFTASHLGALFRLAQLAQSLGANLGDLGEVPDAVAAAMASGPMSVGVPDRLMEFIGGGINQWTAAEAALKVREAAYVATEGLGIEQFLHGPSVALRRTDTLVCFDGGGPWTERIAEIAEAAGQSGVCVKRVSAPGIGEPLSIFPLTVAAQRIALELAENLGTDPDTFGRDIPGREPWGAIRL
jgi:glucosamine--fructose-6-phosphate aminotransferase (isomerizing)